MSIKCEKGEWTQVAANVRKGFIWTGALFPTHVVATYVPAGDPAPTEQNESTVGTTENYFKIESQVDIDVYLFPVDRTLEDVKISI